MRRARHRAIAVLATAAFTALVPVTPALAAASPSVSANVATVGSAPVLPYGAHVEGATPLNQSLSFDVVLKPRNQAALDSFVQQVSTPGSPQYRHFLAPGEYATTFGPTLQAIASVKSSLAALGLTINSVTGSVISVSGSVAQVGSALKTKFSQYQLASGRIARANTTAPALPVSVASLIQAVVGLNTLADVTHPIPVSMARTGRDAALEPHVASGPQPCAAASSTVGSPYTADQIANRYDLNSFYESGHFGDGITVAIFELEPFSTEDIDAYQTCYQTSAVVTTTDVDGGPGIGSGQGEAALDIEDIIGLAPHADIHVYQGPAATSGLLTYGNIYDTYYQIAYDDTAQVVSTSWGACEPETDASFMQAEGDLFQQMAAQGQTIFAASGDAGSADCDRPAGSSPGLAVDDPASQPYVTGVGGTDLASPLGPESVWNDGVLYVPDENAYEISAGGGGISMVWPKPTWQPVRGTKRQVPDVSASADPAHGYAIYVGGQWFAIGGTSAAAPTWAALAALAESSCASPGFGLINPTLYQLEAAGGTEFNDVTSGNNDGNGANSGRYSAGPGYDTASGIGTPRGDLLGEALCAAPNGSGVVTPTAQTVMTGTTAPVTFTFEPQNGTDLENGEVDIVVPANWTQPQSTDPTGLGFVTASTGTAAVSGRTIQIRNLTLAVGGSATITFGAGPGVVAPQSIQTSTFSASERSTPVGAPAPLATQPTIAVLSGRMTVSPNTAPPNSTTNQLTFKYTPPTGIALSAGTLTIKVPAGWSLPQSLDPASAGYVSQPTSDGMPGLLTTSGNVISITGISITATQTVTFIYGDATGNSGGAAIAPPAGTSQFEATEQTDGGAPVHELASSPSVAVGNASSPGGGGGGGGIGGHPDLVRVSGADRVATSVAASNAAFPNANSARVVVLARSDSFADALAGTPLAATEGGPLLLTATATLSTATSTEISRVLPIGSRIYLLGGTSAISPVIATTLAADGYNVARLAGADRYATAVAVANALGNPGTVFEADGTNFPDALSAGTAAAQQGAVILLTAGSKLPSATSGYLTAHPSVRYAVGGPAAKADPGAVPLVGLDRYATSVLVAQKFFTAPLSVGVASGVNFPDALSGGAVAGLNGGPMVLVPNTGTVSAATTNYLRTAAASASKAWLFGGTASINDGVFTQVAGALKAS